MDTDEFTNIIFGFIFGVLVTAFFVLIIMGSTVERSCDNIRFAYDVATVYDPIDDICYIGYEEVLTNLGDVLK